MQVFGEQLKAVCHVFYQRTPKNQLFLNVVFNIAIKQDLNIWVFFIFYIKIKKPYSKIQLQPHDLFLYMYIF